MLETQKVGFCCCLWLSGAWVVLVRPAWGRWWYVSLLGWPSRGLSPVVMLAREPPLVAVVVRRASCSWCRLGSSLLIDDAVDASPSC